MKEQQAPKTQLALLLALFDAWHFAPAALLGAALGYVLQGIMPVAQLLVISWLTRSLAQSRPDLCSIAPTLITATLIIAFTAMLTRIAARMGERLQNAVRYGYRCELAMTIASLPAAQLTDAALLKQLAASQRAIYQLGYLPENVLAVATAVFGAIALSLVVWQLNPIAGIFVFLTLLPTVIGFRAIAQRSNQVWPEVSVYERHAHYAMQQLSDPRPALELATLGTAQRVAALVAHWEQKQLTALQTMLGRAIRIELLVGLSSSVLLGSALAALVSASIGAGDIAAAVIGILSGLAAVRGLGAGIGQLMLDSPRLLELHQLLQHRQNLPAQVPITQAGQLIIKNMSFSYPGSETAAISNISLEVKPGEMVALVGVNGAGKTTCVNSILGLRSPQQGTVLIDGQDASLLSNAERLSHFSLLTQEFGRYELSIRENLLLGVPQLHVSDEQLWEALRLARADDFVRTLPNGLDSQLGAQWGGVGLSGGQWQRLALARIYLRNAGIWVLDEPTSAIDAEAEQEIFHELQANRQQRSTIIVSHRAWTLRGMDRIYVFDQGQIVEQGSYEQLMQARGRFFEIFAAQHNETV